MTKNLTPLTRFAWLFYNQTVYQKSERQIFDRKFSCKIIKQNVSGGSDFFRF